jgi:hypothetical protein
MSHSIHSNQLSVILNEDNNEANDQNISPALRFLEEVDYEEETLRLRRRRRAQRAAGSIAGFRAARASFLR